MTRLLVRKVGGYVADGSVRDFETISGLPLPVFTKGAAATTNLAGTNLATINVVATIGMESR